MFSGNWKEETVVNLPDTNLEAFQLFTKILYSESVELSEAHIDTLDELYYLADKYMVEEIKANITDAAKVVEISALKDLSLLEHIKTDPIKEILTKEIIASLSSHHPVGAVKKENVKFMFMVMKLKAQMNE